MTHRITSQWLLAALCGWAMAASTAWAVDVPRPGPGRQVTKAKLAKAKAAVTRQAVKVVAHAPQPMSVGKKVAVAGTVGSAGGLAAAAALFKNVPEPLSEAELAIAQSVHVGDLPCELGQRVVLRPDDSHPGYFHMALKDQRFHLRPVVSSTGAVRLEDPAQGAVWIQLANKSMLMSSKQGRRLADECAAPVQQAMAEHLKAHPIPSLLDVAPVRARQD